MDEVPRKPLHPCSPFRGITLNSPFATLVAAPAFALRVRPASAGSRAGECDESSDLKEAKSRAQSKIGDRAPGELRVVAINCNPAPDAQDRLSRLFTILLEHAAEERLAASEKGSLSDAPPIEDDAGEEA